MTDRLTESAGTQMRLELAPIENLLTLSAEISLYRVLQEAFTNVVKHANATEVLPALNSSDGRFNVSVEDDGIGFSVGTSKFENGLGMISMRERVPLLKESCAFSRDGTRLTASFPC